MKESNKKVLIIVLNALAIIGNLFSTLSIIAVTFLAPYVEEFNEILKNTQISLLLQIILVSVCIVLNIICLIFSKNIEKNKEKIVLCTIISMIFGTIYNVIIGFISVIAIYKKNKEIKEEQDIPILEEIKVKTLNKVFYAILFVFIFIIFDTSVITAFITDFIKDWNVLIKLISVYLLQILCLSLPFRKNLKRDIKAFWINKKQYFKEIVKTLSIIVLCYIPVALILKLIIGEPTNQTFIKGFPICLTVALSIIIAPICEEILFRGFLRKIFKNDKVFIIVSSLIFGICHCLYIEENWLMYLHIVPYAILGLGLAKVYAKTDNIFTNISIHFIWNSIALCNMFIIGI